jgi:hypothetical protein
MALPTAQANALLDRLFGVSPSATVYLGLFTAAPTDAGGGTEVSGSGYSRQAVAFDAASSRATSNSSEEVFTASGGNWGTIVAIGIFDASTSGNLLWWDGMDTNRTVNDTDTLTFAVGSIDASFAAS